MATSEKPQLTEEQARIYEIIFNMIVKSVLIIASLVAFFIVLYHVLHTHDISEKWVYTVLDGMLSFTTYRVYAHYFTVPTKPKAPAKPKKIPPTTV